MTTTIGLAGVLELLELVGGLLGLWMDWLWLCFACCCVARLLGPLFFYSRTVGSPRQWDISIVF
jgi:hypothetical protein